MANITLAHANAMPAPTWHRLHINDIEAEIPVLEQGDDIELVTDKCEAGLPDAFEKALTTYSKTLTPANTENPCAEAALVPAKSQEDVLNRLALSRFQIQSEKDLASTNLNDTFASGMGSDASSFLRENARGVQVIVVPRDTQNASVQINVAGTANKTTVSALDLIVEEGANASLHILLDGSLTGEGVIGSSVRIFAGENARLDLVLTQTAGDGWIMLDDTGLMLADSARVDVRHTILGAGTSYTGLEGDLRGARARAVVNTRYLGRNKQIRDFNYTIRHHGIRTQSDMNATGVLAGSSKKTLRGTIDLIRGCRGAEGSEIENVLLADDRADNKSIPIILCSEDDVAGNHGATIGHVRPNQLLYLQSRGLSPEAAEQLFLSASFEEAVLTAPNDATREAVLRLGSTVIDNFEETIA